MKPRFFKHFVLAGLIAVCMAAPLHAESEAESRNLFETAGPKQTAKDFKPAPDTINTHFGTLKFEGGAFPTEASVQKIYDEMDLQRATQAYMDFFPALSLYGIVKSQIRDFQFQTSSDVGVMADFMHPSENYLTGNDVTVYAFASLDLKVDGPTVVEIPPGCGPGTVNDAWFRFVIDMGGPGPDRGRGGKYLILPPGYDGDVPDGYFVATSSSYSNWIILRGFLVDGKPDASTKMFKDGS